MLRELRCLGERTLLTMGADRRKFLPWGLDGGEAAEGSHCWVINADETRTELPTKVFTELKKGDRLLVQTPGGGGWGDPGERDPESVRLDLREGLLTPDRAARVYGHYTDGSAQPA